MEALGGYPPKASGSRARLVSLILIATLSITSLYLLHTKLSRNRRHVDFYSFQVKDTKGRSVSLEKYRGKVSLSLVSKSACFVLFLFFTSVLCFALLIVNKNVSIFHTHLLQDFTHCSHEVNLPAWVSILNHITDPTLSGPNGIHFIQYENIIHNIVNTI